MNTHPLILTNLSLSHQSSSHHHQILSPPSPTPSPLQSVTTQITDYQSVCAQIVDKTNWCHSRSIYNNLKTFKSQQKYIKNISYSIGISIKSIIICDFDDTLFPTTAFEILKKQSLTDNFFKFIDKYYDKYPVLPGFVKSINKCINDTYNFMIKQIKENNSMILIISNGNNEWLNHCLYQSHIISNLQSVQNLKKAINDKNIPIRLISAKSEYESTAFIKYLKEIKANYMNHTFCVYCIGDSFKASKMAMNHVFDKNEQFLLIRHKLDVNTKNAKTALQSVLLNIDSFHYWDIYCIIDMILQNNNAHIVYDVFVD